MFYQIRQDDDKIIGDGKVGEVTAKIMKLIER